MEKGNFGGSHVSLNLSRERYADVDNDDLVKSVLLSDVLDAVIEEHKDEKEKLSVVMKMDIEGHECKAVLGSGQFT